MNIHLVGIRLDNIHLYTVTLRVLHQLKAGPTLVAGTDMPNIVVVVVGGWKRFGCSCYYRSDQQRNWTESQRQCQRSGGDLVSIESREEQVSL